VATQEERDAEVRNMEELEEMNKLCARESYPSKDHNK